MLNWGKVTGTVFTVQCWLCTGIFCPVWFWRILQYEHTVRELSIICLSFWLRQVVWRLHSLKVGAHHDESLVEVHMYSRFVRQISTIPYCTYMYSTSSTCNYSYWVRTEYWVRSTPLGLKYCTPIGKRLRIARNTYSIPLYIYIIYIYCIVGSYRQSLAL